MRHQATTLTLATLSTLVLAAPSAVGAVAADATLGATAVPTTPCGGPFTGFQTGSPGSAYAAPTDGVITQWRIRGGMDTSSRTFKLGRYDGTQLSVVASGAETTIPAGQLVSQDVRIPARAGDFLGFYLAAGPDDAGCATTATSAHTYLSYSGDLPPGPVAGQPLETGSGLQLDVAATLEPDADGDGYGDTTQDGCPTQADTQGACRDTTAPQTRITKAKANRLKAKARRATVTVAFAADEAATFRCSVDGSAYKRCNSPVTRKLGAGRHVVRVRAVDAAGNVDATPAVARVTVRAAR